MDCYFCIVNLPGKMGADVCVLPASNDTDAMTAVAALANDWVGYETIFLYFGERFVGSLADRHKGFPASARLDLGTSSASVRSLRTSGSMRTEQSGHSAGPTNKVRRVG